MTSHGRGLAMICTSLPVDTHLAHVAYGFGLLTLTLGNLKIHALVTKKPLLPVTKHYFSL